MTDTLDRDTPITQDIAALTARARDLHITSAESATRAGEFLIALKALGAKIDSTFDPHIKRAHEAHLALVKEKRAVRADLDEAEALVKALLATWDTTREQADAQAREAAEAIRRTAATALDSDAASAEAAGDYERADLLRAHRAHLFPTAIVPTTTKVEGVTFRETWSARIVDLHALIVAAAGHRPWVALLNPNMGALNAQARSLKAQMSIPGVEAVCTKGVAAKVTHLATRTQVDD
jgi:hypothetical protein